MNFRHDLHLHSKLSYCSLHKQQTPENILAIAEKNGLTQICVTDHFWDSNVKIPKTEYYLGEDFNYSPQNYDYIAQSLPLPQSEKTEFLFGCETELAIDGTLGIAPETFDKFSFVIIPTTHLHMTGFTISEEDSEDLGRVADAYVKRLDCVLNMDLPFHKIGIAHLTCRLLAPRHPEDHLKVLDSIPDKVYTELFGKAAKKGVGIELNFDPNYMDDQLRRVLRVFRLAKNAGCKFYFGSDAHSPDGFDHLPKLKEVCIRELGLTVDDEFCLPMKI